MRPSALAHTFTAEGLFSILPEVGDAPPAPSCPCHTEQAAEALPRKGHNVIHRYSSSTSYCYSSGAHVGIHTSMHTTFAAALRRAVDQACSALVLCVTRRKQRQPGITPYDNTTHVPTAGSSAALTKPNLTPTRHPREKCK